MYDYLNHEIIRCFLYQHPNENGNLQTYHGTYTSYVTGEPVPHKSDLYDYGKDFIILDPLPNNIESLFVIHVIENGIVTGSFYAGTPKQVLMQFITNPKFKIWNDDGSRQISLSTYDNIFDYCKGFRQLQDKIIEIKRRHLASLKITSSDNYSQDDMLSDITKTTNRFYQNWIYQKGQIP